MKLSTIINIADRAYPDGLVRQAFKTKKSVGDGLAKFIVHELAETYDPKASNLDQLEEATRVVYNARRELTDVAEALEIAKIANITVHKG
jgi:NurA-like 5'-3' nuclease